ncbi:hypothetical protein FB567DRAFT_551495 [Paraphoma chrysanthemicola]|uniref:RapZ C-terminal domain-containing protein n=1 Tax=Paraphoma chrysanthemicola TaxID=798071 RepID=A0A8K0R1G4_9PLEO|nr:hypothetical protein FB567DRAFT_551495 [Paraphoma chrysanthemicola]
MIHHHTCPYYRPPCWSCACTCQLTHSVQSLHQAAMTPRSSSPPRIQTQVQLRRQAQTQQPYQPPPPPYTPVDPVQATLQIRQGFERATQRLDNLSQLCERRVHFNIPPRMAKRSTSLYSDGICDSRPLERDRLRHRSVSIPDIPRPILRPQLDTLQPTIYIVTFSTDAVPNTSRNVSALLASQIPHRNPPIPHLYTIDARNITPPSAHHCEKYSGISPVIQAVMLNDRAAYKAIKTAMRELLDFGARERAKGPGGKMEVCMTVCCIAGTHRSVAIGELVAQGVKREVGRLGTREGVRVVVRHVHRMKRRGDPF